jgi:hypothetical protein
MTTLIYLLKIGCLNKRQYAWLLFFFSLTGCGMNGSSKESHDLTKIGEYISVPKAVESVAFELVTLPENNDSFPPGPTDSVALVARISFEGVASEKDALRDLREIKSKYHSDIFVRNWLNQNEQRALKRITQSDENVNVLDVSAWSKKKPIYAAAVSADEKTIIIFICYL